MPNRKGIMIKSGQKSVEHPKWGKLVELADGRFRKSFLWRGKMANVYLSEKVCVTCGDRYLSTFRRLISPARNPTCSQKCRSIAMTVADGRKKLKPRPNGSHVQIKCKNHPHADRAGFVYEHRLVAEKSIGRYLKNTERVHHINFIKHDNQEENLFVCKSDTEHFKIHGTLNSCVAELIASGVIIFDRHKKKYLASKSTQCQKSSSNTSTGTPKEKLATLSVAQSRKGSVKKLSQNSETKKTKSLDDSTGGLLASAFFTDAPNLFRIH